MPALATNRVTNDELLAGMRRDRVRQERPAQLEERRKLVAALVVDPAEVRQEAAHATELAKAERDVVAARTTLNDALDRVSALWRESHGRGHRQNRLNDDARAKLRASTHPAVAVVWHAVIQAGYAAMSVRSTVVGLEDVTEEIPATAEESRRGWFRPFVKETIRPVTSHASQVSFLEAIGTARLAVEGLAYRDLSDDDTLAALRVELDSVLRMQLPTNFHHVTNPLALLRQKLNGDPPPWSWTPPRPWECARCFGTWLLRELRCPRCGHRADD